MGASIYIRDKSIFGMSYGSLRQLVDEVCDYLREKVKSAEDFESIDVLQDYNINNYNIPQAHCKRLFDLMTEDWDFNLRSFFHRTFRYEYEYPTRRLMFYVFGDWKRKWDDWDESLSASMGEYDFGRLADMNSVKKENNGGEVITGQKTEVNYDSRYYCGLDYWIHRVCSENTPVTIYFDEPIGGAMDGALENLIIAMAYGAMDEGGLFIG